MRRLFPWVVTLLLIGAIMVWSAGRHVGAAQMHDSPASIQPGADGEGSPQPYAPGGGHFDPSSALPKSPLTGVPAIQPRSGADALPLATPTVTEGDVRGFLAAHPKVLGQLSPGGPIEVVAVRFLSSKEAGALAGIDFGRAADAPLCYVTLRGTFHISGPPSPQGRATTPLTRAHVVFDARSGNLLNTGSSPRDMTP